MKQKEKVIVLGGSGFLGSHFINYQRRNFEIVAPPHSLVDITDLKQVYNFLKKSGAKVVINTTALADVNKAEKEKGDKKGKAYQLNALMVKELSLVCKRLDKHFILLSTDCVFDGRKAISPYSEKDQPNPVNWYGQTKYLGELFLIESGCSYTIARVEMAYSADLNFIRRNDFMRFFLNTFLKNKEFVATTDQKITPIFMPDVAKALGTLVKAKPEGIFHIGATDWISPYDLANLLASEFNFNKELVKPITFKLYSKKLAPRPQYPWLNVTKFQNTFGSNILHNNKQSVRLFTKSVQKYLKGIN